MVLPQIAGSGRPLADVAVYGVQRRSGERIKRPWIVRWAVVGRQRSRSFRTRAEADRFRSGLQLAQQSGERFDETTGEPASWAPRTDQLRSHEWARQWLAEQWDEWAPRTRVSAIEALARLVVLLVPASAPPPPELLRSRVAAWLPPGSEPLDRASAQWLEQWGLSLAQLNRVLLAGVDRQLGQRDDGQPLAPSTAARYRKVSRACIRRAVELEVLPADPWPTPSRGRSQRKALRVRRSVPIRSLPDLATMRRAIDAMVSHQPASRTYRVMTAVAYYAGLRPSEVVMLRAASLHLPQRGWGRIEVTEADVSFDEPGEPKTGPRSVPIPPVLVGILREWVEEHSLSGQALLFRTRTGGRPTQSNWSRSLHRAMRLIDAPPMRIYDCRHAAATTWLRAGVPLGEAAKRLGHSVETLVSTYVGALDGDESLANQRIQAALDPDTTSVGRTTGGRTTSSKIS
jgi:integrase